MHTSYSQFLEVLPQPRPYFSTETSQIFSGIQLNELGYLAAIIGKYVITRIKEWLVMLFHAELRCKLLQNLQKYGF